MLYLLVQNYTIKEIKDISGHMVYKLHSHYKPGSLGIEHFPKYLLEFACIYLDLLGKWVRYLDFLVWYLEL